MTSETTIVRGVWNDPATTPGERVAALMQAMTLEEKVAQLYGCGWEPPPTAARWRRTSTSSALRSTWTRSSRRVWAS